MKENKWLDIYVDLKNSGNNVANSSYFYMRVSKYNSSSVQYASYDFITGDGGIIPANSSKTVSLSQYIYNYVGNLNFVGGTTYYMIISLDPNFKVTESNENNNISIIPFKFEATSSRPPKDLLIQMRPNINNESDILDEPYTVQVYNFSNIKVLEQTVSNKDGESIIIKNLPIGLYIIKSKYGSRKIHVQY
ncbi:MAG: hypothetical protein Q7T92_07625 [Lutibacter sp.]|nr:hypothetical protein [Lutibacter sp.]